MKKIIAVILTIIMIFSLAGCSNNTAPATTPATNSAPAAPTQAPEGTTVLKFGHVNGDTHPCNQAALEFAKTINEKTNGRYRVDVNANGILGGEVDLIEGVMMGSIDICYTAATPLANYVKDLYVCDLPFLIRDSAHADAVYQGEVGDELLAKIEESTGVHAMTFLEIGFRNMVLSTKSIKAVDEINGIKIRTMENKLHLELWEALGASPTPMAFGDAFTALQQGAIDAVEMTNTHVVANGLVDVIKYYAKTNHVYTPGVILLSDTVWSKLSDEDKVIFEEAFAKYAETNNKLTRELDQVNYNKIADAGVEMDELDITELQAKTSSVYENHPELAEMAEKIKNTK